jgi:hypothetical protein
MNNLFFWYTLLPPLKVTFLKVLTLEPKRFEILIFAGSVTPMAPLLSDFKWGHFYVTF